MPTLLENLVIDRVDLCDEGANSEAFIELFKRKELESMDLQEILSKMKPEHAEVVKNALDASNTSLNEAKAATEAVTKERGKAIEDLNAANEKIASIEKKLEEKHPDDCDCEECQARRNKAAKDKASSGNASFDQTETFKSMPKEVQDYLSTIKAQKEAAEAELRKSREEAAEAAAIAKAASLKAIPVEQEKLVNILKTATPEIIDLLEVVNGAIEGTVLGEIGKTASGSSDSNSADAWSKIESKADELSKSNNISKAKAVSEVIRTNPDLYREYLEGGAN
jgi:hypothetical protein